MKKAMAVSTLLLPLLFAQRVTAGGIEDGSAGAAAGTNVYNTFVNPNNPLPVQGGDDAVVRKTISNVGAGKSLKKSFTDAAKSESQVQRSCSPNCKSAK